MGRSTAVSSTRAEATTRRTYNRPIDDAGEKFETWEQTATRAQYDHQLRLWEDAGGKPDFSELNELLELGLDRSGLVAGRTLWLGGTPYAYDRAASQFNCSALEIASVYDMVDSSWLLLNGCGVGAKPKSGTLHGYYCRIPELEIKWSDRDKNWRGDQCNKETPPTAENGWTWTIKVADSAQGWAKLIGKLLLSPRCKVNKVVVDGSDVRGRGGRLKGYGWICNGFQPLGEAVQAIHNILNNQAGNLLDEEDIGDIFNWCGMVLSSRHAAECLVLDEFHPRVGEFSHRKREYWKRNPQRRQSNNSILFWTKPSLAKIIELLHFIYSGGEPGFVNAEAALQKMPWFVLFNPCYEIGLPNGGFCNLVSACLPSFGRNFAKMERALWLLSRANYRQTCVNLEDGLLQKRWHQTNEALRLCGTSLTGIVQAPWLTDYQIRRLRNAAVTGAYSMADELGLPRPKAVTTIKPEGTRSKITNWGGDDCFETAEGMHMPLGQFIFNWINFSVDDPLVAALEAAGHKVMVNPSDRHNMLVRFPVDYSGCPFQTVDGKQVNLESACSQMDRYLRWNRLYADHNVSSTISFSREEIPELAKKIHDNWDSGYIATAFIARNDVTKTAQDLGHPYLPQEVVTEASYREAVSLLRPVDWEKHHTGWYDIGSGAECPGGVCPVK